MVPRMKNWKPLHRWAIGVALLLLTGCDPASVFGSDCTDAGNFAILVAVRSAATNEPLPGATLTIREGEFADSAGGGTVLAAGIEREGTYEVTVERDGFEAWRRDGVRARRTGHCEDLRTVRLTALLRPTS